MATEIVVPRLGWSMEEGTFASWLKNEGDLVEKGEFLFELEGEKAIQEVETFHGGILSLLPNGPQPGDIVQVGQLLGFLLEHGESAPADTTPTSTAAIATDDIPVTPLPARSLPGGGSEPVQSGRIRITPRARRLAGQHGLDWTTLAGSGRDGRIREVDIRAAVDIDDSAGRLQNISPLAQAFISRWEARGAGALPVTLHRRLQVNSLAALKKSENASYNDLLLQFIGRALQSHPHMNSAWTEQGVLHFNDINLALAVDTPAGLVAPVIHDITSLDLPALQARTADLAERSIAGSLTAADHDNATFVVTNLGMFGVEEFTPLLNPPLCATLGIGRISAQPVVEDGQLVAGQVLPLSLTFDHRIVDGAPAARFLDDLCKLITDA